MSHSEVSIIFRANEDLVFSLPDYNMLDIDCTEVNNASGGKKNWIYQITALAASGVITVGIPQFEHFISHELDLLYQAQRIGEIDIEHNGELILKNCTPAQAIEILSKHSGLGSSEHAL